MNTISSDDDVVRLVEEARGGSEKAFTRLVRLFQARVRTYLCRFVEHQDVVDDIAQETFLAAHRSLPEFRGEALFSTWLLGIARHRALMHLREESRRGLNRPVPLESEIAGWLAAKISTGADDCGTHGPELTALQACLKNLPEHSAKLVRDHYFKGRPGPALAQELGKKESTLWVTLMRIRNALRVCIERRLATSGAQS